MYLTISEHTVLDRQTSTFYTHLSVNLFVKSFGGLQWVFE
jgi:hypothetical protein